MTIISDARITFIAGECFTSHLDPVRIGQTDFDDLWAYAFIYDQARGNPAGFSFAMPWRDSQKSAFWRLYLNDFPNNVPAATAWDAFVPMRLVSDPGTVETDLGERIIVDVFGFQFGVVVTITINVAKRAAMTIDQWVDRLRVLRLGRPFIRGQPDKTLDDVFTDLLAFYRKSYFADAQVGTRSAEPFSINTVLQADGASPATPIGSTLHRQLHAVTAWPQDWRTVLLPSANSPDHFLDIRSRNRVAGDALYAAPYGRTVWRPGLFARHQPQNGPQRRHTLSCLAHNLVAGAVQAEMLRLLGLRKAGVPKAKLFVDTATLRRAGRKMHDLHKGKDTFRSSSIKAHLEESGSKSAVNGLLALAKMPPIP